MVATVGIGPDQASLLGSADEPLGRALRASPVLFYGADQGAPGQTHRADDGDDGEEIVGGPGRLKPQRIRPGQAHGLWFPAMAKLERQREGILVAVEQEHAVRSGKESGGAAQPQASMP